MIKGFFTVFSLIDGLASTGQLVLTTGVPRFLSSKGSSKAEAVHVFNDMLLKTQVIVVPKKLRF